MDKNEFKRHLRNEFKKRLKIYLGYSIPTFAIALIASLFVTEFFKLKEIFAFFNGVFFALLATIVSRGLYEAKMNK